MESNKRDFFWPSYVDLMTALFAVVLVLFVLTFFNLTKKKRELEKTVAVKEKEAALLNKVKANNKLFESQPNLFHFDTVFKRIQLAFEIKYRRGLQFYNINQNDIEGDYNNTVTNLNQVATKLKLIIDSFRVQKATDTAMKDISYLMVISGSASRLPGNNEMDNYLLSYKRALHLYKYWKDSLNIDFDSPQYHDIMELQISGVGFGGVGRYNFPYHEENIVEEEKNQRFIIHIAPKIGS